MMNVFTTRIPWRNPYVVVVALVLLLGDAVGIVHSFRAHDAMDGAIALLVPPYGVYRAVESVAHPKGIDAGVLSQTDEGRRQLTQGLQIKEKVWVALLELVTAQQNSSISTVMHENNGAAYDITVTAPATGALSLLIQPQNDKNMSITMTDANRDQTPETIKITKQVNGSAEVHETPIDKFPSDDASQFLLAWSLAWGTVAEQQQARVQPLVHGL